MIIIIGDSWGLGEWDKNSNLSGPGFGQYLMLHEEVINLSLAAGSNSLALDRLEKLFTRFSPNEHDRIFWIVTDPCRDRDYDFDYFACSNGILESARTLLSMSLDRANLIAQKAGITIELIGGLCDLREVDVLDWENLELTVPSWARLIDPTCPGTLIDPMWWEDFGRLLKFNNSILLPEWVDISDSLIHKHEIWKKIFDTDGWHPNRQGNKVLRDHLFPEWSHKY